MPLSASQVHASSTSLRPSSDAVSTTLPADDRRASRSKRRHPVTNALVALTLTWTILELEEHLIPSQGAGDVLYVYAGDVIVTHDIRRTLEVFDGNVEEAVTNICSFVLDGILGNAKASS